MEVEEKIEEKEKNEEIAQPVPPFRNSARRTKRSAHVRLMLQVCTHDMYASCTRHIILMCMM